MTSMRRGALCLAGVSVVLSLTGCAGAAEKAIEGATGTQVDVDGAEVRIENEDGSIVSSSSGNLPEDFPESVVLPQGYTVLTANEQSIEGMVGFILIGSVDAPPADVAAELESAYDVEPTQSFQSGEVRSLEYADVDGIKVGYTINQDADGNAVVTVAAHPVLESTS